MHDDTLERLFGELAGADLPVPPPSAVVARGRQRRRRARGQVLAGAAAAVALLGIALSELTGFHAPAQSPAGRHSKAPSVCPAAPYPALTFELRRRELSATGQTGIRPITLSTDGSTAYVLTTVGDFHGIAAESVATGAIERRIVSLPANGYDAEGGLGPDGELVVRAATALTNGSELWGTVLVFAPRTLAWSPAGTVAELEPAGQHGHALSPPVFSGSAHQLVAWESSGATYDGPTREIVEADLVTGATDVVASGDVGVPVFVGNALVWPVASSATGAYHLVAASASAFPARQPVPVPVPLRAAGQATVIASSGGVTAYASADLTKLFYSPSLSQSARQVLRLPAGDYLAPGGLAVGPGFLGWSLASAASYVASTRSFAAATLTDGTRTYGDVLAAGGFVVARSSPDPKRGSWRLSVLSGATIERLACATAR